MTDASANQLILYRKRQELAKLEAELKAAQRERLPQIAQELGLPSTDELILSLAEFATPALRDVLQRWKSTERADRWAGSGGSYRKRRALITPELRERIIREIKLSGKTAAEIAKQFGISASSVNNMKQRFRLTHRKK